MLSSDQFWKHHCPERENLLSDLKMLGFCDLLFVGSLVWFSFMAYQLFLVI